MGSHIHPHPSPVGMLVPSSARSTGHWSSDLPLGASSEGPRERSPVLGDVELLEGFPVAEMAGMSHSCPLAHGSACVPWYNLAFA